MPAPSEYTVASVMAQSDAPWKGNDGTMMMTHEVAFHGDERTWKIYHPADDGVEVASGATLKGWKNDDKGSFGLAKPKGAGGGGKSRGRDQGEGPGLTWKSKPYERGAEHPRNEARSIHTSSLSSVPAYIDQLLTISLVPQPKTEDEYWALVGRVAKRLTASYQAPLARTETPQTELPVGGAPKPASDVPADTDGLGEQSDVPADVPWS